MKKTSYLPLKPVVETVEKVIFQKWDGYAEKCLVFVLPHNILAVFQPVVGDFCDSFSSQGFFDSLVSPLAESEETRQTSSLI